MQSLISRARRALGDADAIVPAPGGYRLAAAEVDAQRFDQLAAAGAAALRAGDPRRAATDLRDGSDCGAAPRSPT